MRVGFFRTARNWIGRAGRGIAVREVTLKAGCCDYLLLVDRRPVGIIEAKKVGKTLSTVADQSGRYGENLPDFFNIEGPLPFYYESTGIETFFRNERDPEPRSRQLFSFHRPETMADWLKKEATLKEPFGSVPVDSIWGAFERLENRQSSIGNRKSSVHRFADLIPLVRVALEQQPVLKPFAESVNERFNEWLMDKAQAGATFTPDQLAWLNLIRDHISTSLSIEADDFDYAPFAQKGGLGKAAQLFGSDLPTLLEELNEVLAV